MLYQISEVAEILAASERRGRPASYFARQLRAMAQYGILTAEEMSGSGRTAARLFPAESIYKAKIASTLIDLGCSATLQKLAIDKLTDPVTIHLWKELLDRPKIGRGDPLFLCILLGDGRMDSAWHVRLAGGEALSRTRSPALIALELPLLLAEVAIDAREEGARIPAAIQSTDAGHKQTTKDVVARSVPAKQKPEKTGGRRSKKG